MPQIYLYRDPVDFRKSFRGLAAIVEQELGHNPFEGALYAFTNRRRDKIKLLYWEDNGFVLYYKSLAEEKFHWPGGEEELVSEVQPQLVRPQGGTAGAIGEQSQLLFFDTIFHLPSGTVKIFV